MFRSSGETQGFVNPVSPATLKLFSDKVSTSPVSVWVASEPDETIGLLSEILSKNISMIVTDPLAYRLIRNNVLKTVEKISGPLKPVSWSNANANRNLEFEVDDHYPLIKPGAAISSQLPGNADVIRANQATSEIAKKMFLAVAEKKKDDEVLNWSDENEELANELSVSLMNNLGVEDMIDIVIAFMALDAYEGFEPVKFWENKVKRWISKGTVKSKKELMDDMALIIGHYLARGSKMSTDKIKKKTSAGANDVLSTLSSKYTVIDNAAEVGGTKSFKPDDVTIPRLMACLPGVVAKVLARGVGRVLGGFPSALPRWLCFPSGAALIPRDYVHLWVSWLRWSVNFNDIINASKAMRVRQPIKNVFLYGNIAFQSSLFTDAQRKVILNQIESTQTEVTRDSAIPWNTPATEDDRMFLQWIEKTDAKRSDAYAGWLKEEMKRLADVAEKNVRTTTTDSSGNVVSASARLDD